MTGIARRNYPIGPAIGLIRFPVKHPFPERLVLIVAIDIGGTFTDLIGFDEARQTFVQAKSLSTPAQLVNGIIDCLRKSGIEAGAKPAAGACERADCRPRADYRVR